MPYLKKLGFNTAKDLSFLPVSGQTGQGLLERVSNAYIIYIYKTFLLLPLTKENTNKKLYFRNLEIYDNRIVLQFSLTPFNESVMKCIIKMCLIIYMCVFELERRKYFKYSHIFCYFISN